MTKPETGAETRAADTTAAANLAAQIEPPSNRVVGFAYWLTLAIGTGGIALTIHQIWNIALFDIVLVDTSFLFLLLAVYLPLVFLYYPARLADADRIPWYDWLIFAATVSACTYLAAHGDQIVLEGWDLLAPPFATALGGLIVVVCLEAVRRAGGTSLFVICLIFAALPLYSEHLIGFLWGPGMNLAELARAHSMGNESLIGLPMRVTANLLLGFLIFGSALVVTGGGEFFMAFATALMGRSRGGPAKVAILSSGFFGSLSGSVVSNVVTTGQVTIPTMKRIGYPATYAGAVEACASTGGALMPPVMGAVAFIMAEFLNVPYSTIMLAAAVPAVLFYMALILQTDNYAARNGLVGLPPEEIPRLWSVLKDGWYYIFCLAMLVYMLVGLRIDAYAPYYATVVLIISTCLRKRNRFNIRLAGRLIADATRSITSIVGIIVGIGMVLGSLSYTGVGGAFSRELLQFAGDSLLLLLALGALTSFLLGMGMTVSACYIFLAIVLAPALVDSGLDPTASHLFILYWGMMSYITPPVALAAVAASTIARSNALMTGLMAMRLGSVLFVLPFLFVLSPTLILKGAPLDIIHDIGTTVVAIWLLSSALEGWLYKFGALGWERLPVFAAAACFAYPETVSDLIGAVLLGLIYGYSFLRAGPRPTAESSDAQA
jgi:TRAP transporter 4TM/12TM fusion protein